MSTSGNWFPSTITVHVPLKITVRGGRKAVVGPLLERPATRTRFDDSIIKALARAHRWRSRLEDGTYGSVAELATAQKINESYVCRILRLTLLAPDIVESLLAGRDSGLTVEALAKPLPPCWMQQRDWFQGRFR